MTDFILELSMTKGIPMNDAYARLIQEAKAYYGGSKVEGTYVTKGMRKKFAYPKWYELDISGSYTPELNLWNYWQGVANEQADLMLVGQDWGRIDKTSVLYDNIRAIACNPMCETKYLSNCGESLDFDTDAQLIGIFDEHLKRDIRSNRYSDLYFTNLCLGYRQDKTTGYFRHSWLAHDANCYFKRLVDIKKPKVIVCLGRQTSEAAYKVLTGSYLPIPRGRDGFYRFIQAHRGGLPLKEFESVRFFAMAHPGGMGHANYKAASKGKTELVDDWAFLADYLPKGDSTIIA